MVETKEKGKKRIEMIKIMGKKKKKKRKEEEKDTMNGTKLDELGVINYPCIKTMLAPKDNLYS